MNVPTRWSAVMPRPHSTPASLPVRSPTSAQLRRVSV
jgi:hypothetical protein